ncbi:MAG: DNA polymerase I [Candidatus Kapabacteria bacterium]|nr:DNA polymerase I [Candidatus Kapabacteria bacterium]
MKKLLLIDGMSLVFRAYYAMERSNLQTNDGEPTGAVFGFLNILLSVIEKENPDLISVAFDSREPTFRHNLFPQYKANRSAFPEPLVPQLARIKNVLDLLNIHQIQMPGFEADDIIGTMSKLATKLNIFTTCLTSDKDYYQLVDDNVRLIKPGKGSSEFDIVNEKEVYEKFGVKPDQVIDVLALIGDQSDNIPGVKGIGDKTAIPLVQKYGSVEQIYYHINEIESKSVRTKLETDRETAILSKFLVTIKCDMEIEFSEEMFVKKEPDYQNLDKFLTELKFIQLRKKFNDKFIGQKIKSDFISQDSNKDPDQKPEQASIFESQAPEAASIQTIANLDKKYIFVNDLLKLKELTDSMKDIHILSVDLETSSLSRTTCDIVGIALSYRENEAYYIPVSEEVNNPDYVVNPSVENNLFSLFDNSTEIIVINEVNSISSENDYLALNKVLAELKPALESINISKCGQNIKFDAFILARFGLKVHPISFDSMIASYLLNPDMQHNLDALSERYLNYKPIPISSLIGEKKATQLSMKDIPPSKISDYACEDADLALKLYNKLKPKLEQENLSELAYKIEFPLIEVLIRMESEGVTIDVNALQEISQRIGTVIKELREKIFEEAGTEFNLDSPKQLGFILFEKLGIPSQKSNKTGYSTDIQVLTSLAESYKIAEYILEYRQLAKLRSTYIESLPKQINPKSGRIHTSFNQTIAGTGRLSSTDPNLQNIPIRSSVGKEVRKAFIARNEKYKILSADYSQIELRIMAYYCQDKHLIEAFVNKQDIHTATAAVLFDKSLENVDQDMRRTAKTVNFGIMYGLGAFGLSQRLGISRKEASEIINNYFNKYPGIKRYIEDTISKTRNSGFAETLCKRRKYFPEIASNNHNMRASAERAAINMPIQGTAADMMKIAMINIDRRLREEGLISKMIIQVHDELVFDVLDEEIDQLSKIIRFEMENALNLENVPIEVEIGIASNWFDAH